MHTCTVEQSPSRMLTGEHCSHQPHGILLCIVQTAYSNNLLSLFGMKEHAFVAVSSTCSDPPTHFVHFACPFGKSVPENA